jgi:hypothetical protein
MEEINRRLCDFASICDWREDALLDALKKVLGGWYALFRLVWEWQKRVCCGVPRGGRFRVALVLRMEDWRELGVSLGSVVCICGFWLLTSVAEEEPRDMAMCEGEVEVRFEVGAEDLRRVVRRGRRGYACSRGEGLLPPFAPLRVCGLWNGPKGAVVELMAVGSRRHSLGRGRGESPGTVLLRGRAEEAERWFGKAVSAVGKGEAAGCLEKAARLGHVEAMYRLGLLHGGGEDVPVDAGAAAAWYRKAAELGHAGAMFNLAAACRRGEGVPVDGMAAVGWYRKAAELGHAGQCAIWVRRFDRAGSAD